MVAAQTNGCFDTATRWRRSPAGGRHRRRARVCPHARGTRRDLLDPGPELFRRPVTTGLGDAFEALIAEDDDRGLHLVAEVDGEPAAVLGARLLPPEDDAAQQIQRDAASTRLRIEYLVTAAACRRRGLASRLVDAAEAWGRENGATVAETWTYQRSPTSFPFWRHGAGYAERSVNLRKSLL